MVRHQAPRLAARERTDDLTALAHPDPFLLKRNSQLTHVVGRYGLQIAQPSLTVSEDRFASAGRRCAPCALASAFAALSISTARSAISFASIISE
jgi:hypothetical protein